MANKNHPIFIFLSSVCFYVSLFKILWFGIGLADGEDINYLKISLFINLIAYFCELEFSNFEIDQVDYGAWGVSYGGFNFGAVSDRNDVGAVMMMMLMMRLRTRLLLASLRWGLRHLAIKIHFFEHFTLNTFQISFLVKPCLMLPLIKL